MSLLHPSETTENSLNNLSKVDCDLFLTLLGQQPSFQLLREFLKESPRKLRSHISKSASILVVFKNRSFMVVVQALRINGSSFASFRLHANEAVA